MKRMRRVVIVLLALSAGSWVLAKENGRRFTAPVAKILGSPTWTRLNVNYISTSFNVDGRSDMSLVNPGALTGLFYPKGSGKGAVCAAGLLWGARAGIGEKIRIGGTTWESHLAPGKILDSLKPESSDLPKNRVYRVRPDIPPGNQTANISSEVNDGEGSPGTIYDQYQKDWVEWPWQDGAPYDDKDKNSVYDPAIDVPGVPGADQTIWGVARDVPNTQLFGTPPLGIEMQTTVWGYSSEGALGHMLFRRYVLINRNSIPFDSMYVSMWTDPDLGNAGDDLVGCDIARSLGYIYNGQATDNVYSPLPPPAVGFDFFQGPIVPGAPTDSAIFKGKRVFGKRNLPLTAFFANTAGAIDPVLQDPLETGGDPGVLQMYRALQGLLALTGNPYVDPATGAPTKFPFAGDPEKQTGWLDGTHGLTFGDRRFGISSGPFTMMPGDTQEVVVAEICAGATPDVDRLSAIGLLKFYDDQAQTAYNNFFHIPSAPSPPKVTLSALDGEIILSWEDDSAAVSSTELPSPLGYAFEGYNVYQFPSSSSSIDQAKRLRTFDIINGVGKIQDAVFDPNQGVVTTKVVRFGTDSGIERSLRLTTDPFNSDRPLVNGTKYYYGVTAYNYNPFPGTIPSTLETPPVILTAVPHSPDPGTRYPYNRGDTVKTVTNVVGFNDALVNPVIWNRTRQLGQTYSLSFDTAYLSYIVWTLTNERSGEVVARRVMDSTGLDEHRIPDGGFSLYVGPPPSGMKSVADPATGNSIFAGDAKGSGQVILSSDGTLAALAGLGAKANHNYEIRFDGTGSIALWCIGRLLVPRAAIRVPFSVWDVGRVSGDTPVQMMAAFRDMDTSNSWTVQRDPATVGGKDYRAFDPIYITAIPYVDSAAIWTQRIPIRKAGTDPKDANSAVLNAAIANQGATNTTPPATGSAFRFNKVLEIRTGDVKRITPTPATIGNVAIARDDVQQINVFPNPYYGVNPQELNKYQRFVTFNHIPQKAIIRIFNLAGVMVRLISRERDSQFEQWDLKNDSGLPVGSGLYIAYIEMPDLGATKILKIAIVQEQQILDRY